MIFISIASYRDEELEKTVRSLYDNAMYPKNLRFGIVNQDARGRHADFSWLGNQARVHNMHYKDAKGAGYARKLAMELYNGEQFFFQVDSHMRFAKGWDTKLIDMYNWCVKDAGTNKVILSQFAAPFLVGSDGKDYYIHDDEDFWEEPSWTSVVNTYYGAWAGNREKMEDFSKPHKSHTVLGALLFSHGSIVNEIPYDERISFMGEELCYAIRAYTRGYEIYAPHEMLAWHFYKREERPKVWGDKKAAWFDIEKASKDTQKNVLTGREKGVFGIGDYNRYLEYQEMIGIDFNKFYEVEPEPKTDLDFVSEEMTFDMGEPELMSGPCLTDNHKYCSVGVCACDCHKENNG